MYDGYKALVANVFNKAISDYKNLLKMQKKEKLDEEQKERIQREIKENERFFRSECAKDLAEYVDIKFSPEKLIEKLRSEV
jgi:light-regulated signal transduction histidine kinase (bacteriophytochrome)